MAHWLELTLDDAEDDHEVNAEQVLGDRSPLVFEDGYAAVDDEDDADELARRYTTIERTMPPEDADDRPADDALSAEQLADERDDLDPDDVGEGGGGEVADDETRTDRDDDDGEGNGDEDEDTDEDAEEGDEETEGDDVDELLDGTVVDVRDALESGDYDDQLDAIEERADRAGVENAVADRRGNGDLEG